MEVGIDISDLLMYGGMLLVATVGWLIKDAIQNFRKSVEKLDENLEKLVDRQAKTDHKVLELELKLENMK